MSKSELKQEKKKRKREDAPAEVILKRSKKSKTSDPTTEEVAIDAPAVRKKEKKSKKAKQESDQPAGESVAPNGISSANPFQADFISLDVGDIPMVDAPGDVVDPLLFRDQKKPKKDKKDKKAKKSKEERKVKKAKISAPEGSKSNSKDASESTQTGTSHGDQVPVSEATANLDATDDVPIEEVKKAKKVKKSKTSTKVQDNLEIDPSPVIQDTRNGDAEHVTSESAIATDIASKPKREKKEKREKKGEKDKKDKSEKTGKPKSATEELTLDTQKHGGTESNALVTASNGEQLEAQGPADSTADQEQANKASRFIVFVGNIPFTATKEQIENHFAKLKPFEIRMRTYKEGGKFMGTCFIEFERFDHMQTALTKYHHSVFPVEGKKKKDEEGRKINVELSAGGGGNTQARQEKIRVKNEKLQDQRQRAREKRDEIESKQKERKEKKKSVQGTSDDPAGNEPAADPNEGIHPARLAMMNGPSKREDRGPPPRRGGGRKRF